MLTTFVAAFGLGLVFNAVPGAIFAETVRQGVHGGFKPALAVQIGSLVGDALWAVLGLIGIGLLLQVESLRVPVGIAGAVYLGWLAWDAWRAANKELVINRRGAALSTRAALRSGALLSVTNPHNVAYWAALGSALGAIGIHDPQLTDYAVFFAGFMASSVLWCFFCAAMVDRIFRSIGARWARVTYRACAIAFLALAISSVRDLMKSDASLRKPETPAIHGKP
ncbi:MAG TPA: LysE family transporter [Burkholderiales bacterium]|nr:LysE family transporter [Burkholderiales bacterium]